MQGMPSNEYGGVANVVQATAEGEGWEAYENKITAASNESELIHALSTLHTDLLSGSCLPNEEILKQCCMNKYNQVGGTNGGVWTRQVAQWYLRCINTYATPVVPTIAYEGQYFPPAYLFTPPPSALIPVVPVPAPVMVVTGAVVIPEHNDAAWAIPVANAAIVEQYDNDGEPVASSVAVDAEEKVTEPSSTSTINPSSDGGAMWVDFDKNVTIEPKEIKQVPFVYTAPSDGSACWVTDGKNDIFHYSSY
jgi:hypothetical protein